MRVGITVGSRNIADLGIMLAALIEYLKRRGCRPEVVACMGSHGGATSGGQQAVLASLGVTSERLGVPVRCDPRTTLVGRTVQGRPVYVIERLLEYDSVVVFNRIKPHTAFRGLIGSGLLKMLAVGAGGPEGAATVHVGGGQAMAERVLDIGSYLLSRLPVIAGIAVLENGYGEVARVEGLAPEEMPQAEMELLNEADALLPRLPFSEIDLLIVEEMGKDISGTGMDTNVIGRWRQGYQAEPESPRVHRLVVLDLSPGSQGNANGIGLADFATQALVEKIDYHATYLNALTTGFTQRAMLPLIYPTELEAVEAGWISLGRPPSDKVRAVQIVNTARLERLALSEALWSAAEVHPGLRREGGEYWLQLRGSGRLPRIAEISTVRRA
ncbi:MAG: DUF362 domain-containing protein [Moorellales bacterium]